jgi:hypothetical protein
MYKNKLLITASLLIIVSFFAITCTRTNEKAETPQGIMEIRERMFATQVRDIYLNANNNLGRTISLEGIFKVWPANEEALYYVIRYFQDGCCDGMAGFEVKWAQTTFDASDAVQYPADDSWVEATGILKEYERNFTKYLYLELSSLTVLDIRGVEVVRQ